MSKNIFQIWKEIGKKVPFGVRRDNWSNEYYTIVEKIEIRRWPYGSAFGYPTINGKYSNHYEYSNEWVKAKLIPGAGSYQWTFAPVAKLPEMNKDNIPSQNKKNKKLNEFSKTSFFDFGKYKGKTLENIFKENPNYIFWCIRNIPSFYVHTANLKELSTAQGHSIPQDIWVILDGKKSFYTS